MSLEMLWGEERKCSATVVGLDLVLALSQVRRCSLKIFSNRDSIRKAREAFLILKGRTIDPNGLNVREESY